MSEDTTEKGAAPDEAEDIKEKASIFDQPEGTDWYLAWIISHAEAFGLELGVTLSVGGQLVSGRLISARKYFTQMGKVIGGAGMSGDPEGAIQNVLVESFSKWAELFPATGQQSLEEGKYSYIHLADARFPNGSKNTIVNQGVLWRGKLEAVDAFFVGIIGEVN